MSARSCPCGDQDRRNDPPRRKGGNRVTVGRNRRGVGRTARGNERWGEKSDSDQPGVFCAECAKEPPPVRPCGEEPEAGVGCGSASVGDQISSAPSVPPSTISTGNQNTIHRLSNGQ